MNALGSATDACESLRGEVAEFPDVLGAEVGQLALFPIGPQVLDGIEFGSVGGQVGQGEAVGVFSRWRRTRRLRWIWARSQMSSSLPRKCRRS